MRLKKKTFLAGAALAAAALIIVKHKTGDLKVE
jgi:hypothetical protein